MQSPYFLDTFSNDTPERVKPFKADPTKQERFEQFLKDEYQGGFRSTESGGNSKMSESARARERLDFELAEMSASASHDLQFTSGGLEVAFAEDSWLIFHLVAALIVGKDKNVKELGLLFMLRSSLWLQFKPHHIAAGAAYFAAKILNFDLATHHGMWQEFRITPSICQGICMQVDAHENVIKARVL
ncbi:hypothetical protein IFM89_030339 [Coptis chinensis]|uniref:Uncharacterized protein n=1 Tax=Coptis chinensis TaxID=261450 RepID=A0A835IHK4_9MAGN|nr:hypothetical protein IFM89_030339 [Coptis chinensis]